MYVENVYLIPSLEGISVLAPWSRAQFRCERETDDMTSHIQLCSKTLLTQFTVYTDIRQSPTGCINLRSAPGHHFSRQTSCLIIAYNSLALPC